MGLTPGYLVSKHVRLVREHRRGGMGSVWIADHLALQTQVAVKFMAEAILEDAEAQARFTREATCAAQIKSPHVVQVHDHGVTPEGVPFMVMELLHGEDLSTRVKRERVIPFEDAREILAQVCRVLGRAHALGIVHRDIKPSNIFLLDTDGEIFVKVLDFGVAKLGDERASELTTTGAMVGTLVYMSPEQLLRAKSVDHRADLWSLAVVLYRAVTGKLPFDTEDGLGALCQALERGKFPTASSLAPDIPPEIDAWFERAFAPKIEERFASAKEMAEALHRAAGLAMPPSRRSSVPVRQGTEGEGSVEGASAVARRRDDPPSSSEAPAQTFAGTASTAHRARGRATFRKMVAGGVALGVLVGAAIVGKSRMKGPAPVGPSAAMAPQVAPSPAPAEAAPAQRVVPASVTVAASSKTPEVTVATAVPTAAAAPSASASAAATGKARSSQTGAGARRGQPEKDYGF